MVTMPFAYDIPQHPDDNNRDAYWRRKLKEDFEEDEGVEEEDEDTNEDE